MQKAAGPQEPPALSVERLVVAYGPIVALTDVSFDVPKGQVFSLLGANGAGKSTLARAVAGLVVPQSGSIRINGVNVANHAAHVAARAGVLLIPEGRGVFPHLTVAENLDIALRGKVSREFRQTSRDLVFGRFPVLKERLTQLAGTLSGGEQQMLSLARILTSSPSLVVADEISLGLAPKFVDACFAAIESLKREGTTILLIEQYVDRALSLADRVMILQRGKTLWVGAAQDAKASIQRSYLGGEATSHSN